MKYDYVKRIKHKITIPAIKVDWNKLFDVSDRIGWKEKYIKYRPIKYDYVKKQKKSDGWLIGLLLIIAFIIMIGLIISVDWQACADSPKGFCG